MKKIAALVSAFLIAATTVTMAPQANAEPTPDQDVAVQQNERRAREAREQRENERIQRWRRDRDPSWQDLWERTHRTGRGEISPLIWTGYYEWDGPGADRLVDNGEALGSFVRTLNCETILVAEKRTDRSSRFFRVEHEWPGADSMITYPDNVWTTTVLKPYQPGWNIVYGWTLDDLSQDTKRVVWVPDCDDDLDPHTT